MSGIWQRQILSFTCGILWGLGRGFFRPQKWQMKQKMFFTKFGADYELFKRIPLTLSEQIRNKRVLWKAFKYDSRFFKWKQIAILLFYTHRSVLIRKRPMKYDESRADFCHIFGLTPFLCKIASPLESPSKNRPSSQNQSQNVKVTDGATASYQHLHIVQLFWHPVSSPWSLWFNIYAWLATYYVWSKSFVIRL